MKRFNFVMWALLLCLPLYGCGGGGGTSADKGGTTTGGPTVTAFTIPAAAATLSVAITTLTASDTSGVTGYLVTESQSAPAASASGWTAGAPATYTFSSAGSHTVYAWAKNGSGAVSAGVAATVVITLSDSGVLAKAVTGCVKDPVNGDGPATGTVVRAYADGSAGSPVATANVASDGSFNLPGLIDGRSYSLVFSRTGYGDVTYYGVRPSQATETALETVRLLPTAKLTQSGPINGYLTNAANNQPLPYLTVMFRPGMGATTGDPIAQSTTTDSTGYYSRPSFPAGSYTAEVLSSGGTSLGYFTVDSVPGFPVYNNSQNCAFSTGSGVDSYRAVLTWGNSPQDLDFHLTGPLTPGDTTTVIGTNDTPRFHIDSTQKTYPYDSGVVDSIPMVPGSATESYLDFDQVNHGVDNGAEALTILTQRSGPYRFYVYNNSAVGTLSGSGAVVRLYLGATLLRSFPVPALTGNTWHVFDLDGSTITAVNTVSTVPPDQTYTLARRLFASPLEEALLFRRVIKTVRAR